MIEGKAEELEVHDRLAWNHTSSLLATVLNAHGGRGRHKPGYRPEEFNPYAGGRKRRSGIQITRENIGLLKEAFVKKQTRGG